MFSQADRLQIQQKGLTIDVVNQQINFFKKGVPFLNIVKPAVSSDGISVLNDQDIKKYTSVYENLRKDKKLIKFVPASGAATRMFKALYEYLAKPSSAIIADDVAQVIHKIQYFAFIDELNDLIKKKGQDLAKMLTDSLYKDIISYIVNDDGLNYGNLPKGLLKFHSYNDGSRTPMEEHMVEGALYAANSDNSVVVHFTVSPEHLEAFSKLADQVKAKYQKVFGVKYFISFSVQKPSTDTIAVDGKNNPFRNKDGTLVFRPGGHGALLDNLNDLNADIIFLKNIDNVVPDRLKDETIKYKKVIAGLLFSLQATVFDYLDKLEQPQTSDEFLKEVTTFIEISLGYRFASSFSSSDNDKKKQILMGVLNRPIRVCGMVKNTGEPGGGPFWVKSKDGSLSLQILESSQFNLEEEQHRQAFKKATHFNPVDIVISTVDYKGNKFDLKQYRDPETGFISLKSKDGMELKALELPGLWNGAMAFWNTVFVEVPIITFNPVKSINDLLRSEHQKEQA
jgi:hypothetical protein